ncbi:hypothetical protein DRE_03036 [Drechslerella stenobrocha 248]|uniref:Uncharacterized protein n=1 Tax=Drechslerella stenobrocha 248 TaxID=1043628 RepID=W7HUF0_9PEZI|nr:hypothetical protein DRE_03036 [Drechslerella stenobrocha 248]
MSTPTVNDYVADPGDHGVMARYQSFNLSPGADAAMELLEALFVLHDEVFGKTHRGLITLEKRMGPVFEDVEAVSPADEDFLSSLIQNDGWMLPQLWDAMECQYFLVDKHQQNPFKQFRKPTHAALTRTGFIKFLILRYLESLDNRDSKAYNTLVGLSDKYRLLIPGTARPVMPLHDRAQVDANFRDLARELQIPSDRILRQLKAFRATGPIKPGPTATAPATSRDSPPPPPLPARPRANSRGNISITSSSSGSIDSSDISSIAAACTTSTEPTAFGSRD